MIHPSIWIIDCELSSTLFDLRQRLVINNTCEMIAGGDGQLFLSSKGTNQFFAGREMLLGFMASMGLTVL